MRGYGGVVRRAGCWRTIGIFTEGCRAEGDLLPFRFLPDGNKRPDGTRVVARRLAEGHLGAVRGTLQCVTDGVIDRLEDGAFVRKFYFQFCWVHVHVDRRGAHGE